MSKLCRQPDRAAAPSKVAQLQARLQEVEAILYAIQSGQADAIVRCNGTEDQVFTLAGAEYVYRVMVESMGEGALTLDGKGTVLYANQRFAQMLKMDLGRVIGASMKQLMVPASIAEFERLLREVNGKASDGTLRLLRSDGTKVSAHMTLRSSGDEHHSTIVAVATDLSEIMRAAADRDQLARIVESAIEAIIAVDLNLNITSWNKGAKLLYGYTADEVIGRGIDVIVPAGRMQELRELTDNVFAGGVVEQHETAYLTKTGAPRDVLVTLSPVLDGDATIAGVSAIMHDISERKRLERLQDAFVSTVSHELRTPLTSISASLALLAAEKIGKTTVRTRNFINIASRNAERLNRLVNDILDVEKIQSGRMEFDLVVVAIEPVLRNAIDAIRPLANARGITVVEDCADPSLEVTADTDRLSQAITNILSNAIKFSPLGDEITVRLEDMGGGLRIAVIDRGPGIPEEFRDRVFERFAQADSSSTRFNPGTGLGLNISREIIERLGGRISFESVVGKGTTFYIDLPKAGPAMREPAELLGHQRSALGAGHK
jgi:PAS domain S-box-containing protein